MSRLHPTARALIAAAKRREGGLPPEARDRVHRSVIERAALGVAATGAAATSATSAAAGTAAAKTGLAVLVAGHPFVAGGLALVLAAGSGLAVGRVWRASLDTSARAPSVAGGPAAGAVPSVAAPGMAVVAPSGVESVTTSLAASPVAAPAIVTPVATVPGPISGMTSATSAVRVVSPVAPVAASPLAAQSSEARIGENAPSLAVRPALSATPAISASPVASALGSGDARSAGSETDPLAAQLPVLHRAYAELRAHRPARALALLDQFAAVLRTGPLVEEAELARVSALCQIGNTADSQSAIERFVARWPGSPMAVSLRSGCPSEDPSTGPAENRHGSR